jgi:nitric oxide reductase activation protein
MNYKEEFERELNETKKNRNAFLQDEKVQKNAFADYIKEAIPTFIEEQKQLEEKEKQENKFVKFLKRLLQVL